MRSLGSGASEATSGAAAAGGGEDAPGGASAGADAASGDPAEAILEAVLVAGPFCPATFGPAVIAAGYATAVAATIASATGQPAQPAAGASSASSGARGSGSRREVSVAESGVVVPRATAPTPPWAASLERTRIAGAGAHEDPALRLVSGVGRSHRISPCSSRASAHNCCRCRRRLPPCGDACLPL